MKTIFVSIASYRDSECPITIRSLFESAKNPERIYIGICQQNKIEDTECYNKNDEYVSKFSKNIRQIKLPHFEAKGPTWARYLCSRLWDGEDYYFQIDSHTKVIKNWDEILINMMENLQKENNNEKIIISHYPPVIEDYAPDQIDEIVPRICKSYFNEHGVISLKAAEKIKTEGKTHLVPYMAAGMFFANSSFLQDIPFDPNLSFLFIGEEILLSARFWTYGWDIYTPSQNIAYHYYTRKDEPKFWTDLKYSDEEAIMRLKKLLQLTEESDATYENYGLGNIRSLSEYYEFSGIDKTSKTVDKDFCKVEPTQQIEHFGNIGQYTLSSRILSPGFILFVFIVLFIILRY